MPITATCGACGKTYQAPDTMAGKNVRCKACGQIFHVPAPDIGDLSAESNVDFDALERSVSGETLHATASGPAIDPAGKVRIGRPSDVSDLGIRGESGGPGVRSNFRYRYPYAKQVDQFLPWLLVILTGYVVVRMSLNYDANALDGPPPTGVGVSRALLLIGAYVVLIWPASHIALKMASRKLRFSMPRAAAWRSFAAFSPLLLLGGGLFIMSGGTTFGLIMGVLLGLLMAVGAMTLLFRLFPNELPEVSAHAAGGALAGTLAAVAAIVAINVVGRTIAQMDKKEPTLFTSPIAIGLPWVDRPVKLAGGPKSTVKPVAPAPGSTTAPAPTPTPTPTPTGPVAPVISGSALLRPISLSRPANAPQIATVHATPIFGFEEIVTTPVGSNVLGVIRNSSAGGVIELWDRSTWNHSASAVGRGFIRGQAPLFPNTSGDLVVRLVSDPTLRIEQLPLANTVTVLPIYPESPGTRSILGFVGERQLLVRNRTGDSMALERYTLGGERSAKADASWDLNTPSSSQLQFARSAEHVLRHSPDGKFLVAAGRSTGPNTPAQLVLYDAKNPAAARDARIVRVRPEFHFRPLGLALNNKGKCALLLESADEAHLTLWQFATDVIMGSTDESAEAVADQKVGVLSAIRPGSWNETSDPVVWVNDDTLLLYGNTLVDARTGRPMDRLGIDGAVAQFPAGENSVLIVQSQGYMNTLLVATFDPAVLKAARGR